MIAAAGSGSRLGAGGPKALVEVAGRPLVAWSVLALGTAERVAGIVIAAPPGHEEDVARAADEPGVTVVSGAGSRSGSVANALATVETELVVIHDAARPLAAPALFDAVVAELTADEEAAGVIAGAPVADTLKRAASGDLTITETVDRAGLWAVQTPQAFRTAALRDAHAADPVRVAAATDDAMVVEAAGGRVRVHAVAEPNAKVTSPADLAIATALLAAR